ncbi:hypothetical protein NliqN6_6346 [Naganishia liquefaciens]|uniref:Pitrilysin n=1 Tax=Naganishia liquefaciens TaxID=104408 RepID=A0A8H3U184_9TREE|nr:hypothetical protein NliqN6_6346 [Naganishia liquefaciens]
MTRLILPSRETRPHRWFTLRNGMECIVVCAEGQKAGAAMDVGVGHGEDDTEGQAHFCEHLLFLGTKKYPNENDYKSYLAAHGGTSGAYTGVCNTNFRFEVAPDALKGALDRFACFFSQPLFDASCVEREVNAVNSEHAKNLQSDIWRFFQLEKHLCAPGHPYTKFGTGTRETLWDGPRRHGRDPRLDLISWWEKQYCARRMKLVVLGQESLDTLECWVRERFEDVPVRTDGMRLTYSERVLEEEQTGNIIFTEPVMDVRGMEFTFPFPEQSHLYETKPGAYLIHFLGHGGLGSVLSYLKRRGWANSVRAGFQTGTSGFELFKITLDLTVDGLAHYQEVIAAVYRYINLLRNRSPEKYTFDEIKSLSKMEFRFHEPAQGSEYASEIAKHMQAPVPRETVISGRWLMERFDADAIVEALERLDIRKGNVAVTAKVMPSSVGPLDQFEPVYGTRYRKDQMPTEIIAALNGGSDQELFLPGPNWFIPGNFDVVQFEVDEPIARPTVLRDTTVSRLWHKRDDTFWVPKANVFIALQSPMLDASANKATTARLFFNLFLDSIAEELYDVERAGLQFSVENTPTAVVVKVMGYNDTLVVLLPRMLALLRRFEPPTERFESVRDQLAREWISTQSQEPFALAAYWAEYAISERQFSPLERLAELQRIHVIDVKNFAKEFFAAFAIETLVHGNIDSESAMDLQDTIERILNIESAIPSPRPVERSRILPRGTEHVWPIQVPNPNNVNSACEYYCQVGTSDDDNLRCRLALFAHIVDQPIFSRLRTQEQLGYSVWSGPRISAGNMGFHVLLQGEKSATFVETRIEACFDDLCRILNDMPDGEFEANLRGLIGKRRQKPKNLEEETLQYWRHMRDGDYDFERQSRDAAILEQISKQDVIDVFMTYLHPSSRSRRKLSVHLNSQYQGVKFDPQRAMPMIQAFFMKGIPVSQQKLMVLMTSQPGVSEIKMFATDCLADAPALSPQDRTVLEGMIGDLGSMVADDQETGAELRVTNKSISDIDAFKADLELSPPIRSRA